MESKSRLEKINYLKKLLNQNDDELRVFITERNSDEVTMIYNGKTNTITRSEYEAMKDKTRDATYIDFNLAK